jgi:hypothetical protein
MSLRDPTLIISAPTIGENPATRATTNNDIINFDHIFLANIFSFPPSYESVIFIGFLPNSFGYHLLFYTPDKPGKNIATKIPGHKVNFG